jgi:hypothetical protein
MTGIACNVALILAIAIVACGCSHCRGIRHKGIRIKPLSLSDRRRRLRGTRCPLARWAMPLGCRVALLQNFHDAPEFSFFETAGL